ncbi:peptidoglycan DD-metalloendopeptidase family protein [Egicoccus sp. AB-alg2]|uniref:peptidoglycan DD-metalloendopeptidase family protein n=1 Tax=Egicoccus sp. AB-alg2 TaxID=3242693 RepID=UPI00359CBF2A
MSARVVGAPAAAGPVVALVLVLLLGVAAAEGVAAPHRPPVDLEVLRGFEPPGHAFGPGHRGVDLRAAPGTPVRASAAGVVAHAGPVAGVVWVSLDHAGGLTTSYGPLRELAVTAGERVAAGQVLGAVAAGGHGDGGTDRGLHWGARRDGVYIDPLTLLGPDRVPSLVGAGGWAPTDLAVDPYEPWAGARLGGIGVHGSPVADRPGWALPPNMHHLVLVGGLNSAGNSRLLDPEHLGYPPDSASRFSYAGLDPDGNPRTYGPADTWEGIDAAARRLAEQLREQQRRQPFRPVDLVGHSQGGVVILHYLTHYHDAYDPSLPGIGNVVTIASPHRGSALANLGASARDHHLAGYGVAGAAAVIDRDGDTWAGMFDRSVDELATRSPQLEQLAARWQQTVDAATAGPLAAGTRLLTVGGTRDYVVTPDRAQLPASAASDDVVADHRLLPGGHDAVLHTEAMRQVVYGFLAGEDVPDSPGRLAHELWTIGGKTLDEAALLTDLHDLANLPRQALRLRRTPPTVPAR